MTTESTVAGTLRGVRVLELGHEVSIPFAAQVLTQLGATTTKVEPPSGDPSRRPAPFLSGVPREDEGALFSFLGRGKRSIALDLSMETARGILAQLADAADLILADEWLLDQLGRDEAVRWLEPRAAAVRLLLTPFGLTGPYASYRSSPLVSYHSGVGGSFLPAEPSSITFPDAGPVVPGGRWGEYQCGMVTAFAALDALLDDDAPFLELSRQEILLNLIRTEIERWPVVGRRITFRDPYRSSVGGVMEAADGYICVGMMEDHQWESWLHVLGDPPRGGDARLSGPDSRLANWELAYEVSTAETVKYTRETLFEKGQAAGVPISPVLTVEEAVNEAYGLSLPLLTHVQAAGRDLRWPAWPAEFDGQRIPIAAERNAPLIGEHTAEILTELGYTAPQISAMRRFGVVHASRRQEAAR